MTDGEKLVLTAVATIAGSLISAFVAVRLSIDQFRSQKLWERKFQAYLDTITALAEIDFVYREYLSEVTTSFRLSPEDKTALHIRRYNAENTLKTLSPTRALLLSLSAGDALYQLERQFGTDVQVDGYVVFQQHLKWLSDCLSVIRAEPRDLGLDTLFSRYETDMADFRRSMTPIK